MNSKPLAVQDPLRRGRGSIPEAGPFVGGAARGPLSPAPPWGRLPPPWGPLVRPPAPCSPLRGLRSALCGGGRAGLRARPCSRASVRSAPLRPLAARPRRLSARLLVLPAARPAPPPGRFAPRRRALGGSPPRRASRVVVLVWCRRGLRRAGPRYAQARRLCWRRKRAAGFHYRRRSAIA